MSSRKRFGGSPRRLMYAEIGRLLLFLLVIGSGVSRGAANPDFDAIFNPLIDAKSPGAAVMMRKNGRTIFMGGYGVTDLQTFRRIDPHTNFRLASFSKQFTAMAIMLLVHDGKLRYDQNLAEIFPGFPTYGREITVRHLLTHTAGLADYETLMEQKEKSDGPIWS